MPEKGILGLTVHGSCHIVTVNAFTHNIVEFDQHLRGKHPVISHFTLLGHLGNFIFCHYNCYTLHLSERQIYFLEIIEMQT